MHRIENSYNYISIDNYIKGETKDFSNIYQIGPKSKIIGCLKSYLRHNPDQVTKVAYIVDNLDDLLKSEYTREGFLDILRYLINNGRRYSGHFYENLLELLKGTEEETISVYRRIHLNAAEYQQMMYVLKKKFPNQKNEYVYLEQTYKKYLKEYGIDNNKKQRNTYVCEYIKNTKVTPKNDEILDWLYKSGLCYEEFCSKTGYSISTINHILSSNAKNYQEKIEAVKKRDNTEFIDYMRGVIYDMVQIKDFDILDYYDRTKLTDFDFKKYIPNTLDVENKKAIYSILNQTKTKIYGGRRSIISSKTTINGIEVTPQEKERLFDYMDEKGYPDCIYRTVLNKYLAGEISFDQKVKVK